ESSFRSELADQVPGVADKEITPSEQIDAMLFKLMQEVHNEEEPMETGQAVAPLFIPIPEQLQREEGGPAEADNHPCRQQIVTHLRHEVHHRRADEDHDQQKL